MSKFKNCFADALRLGKYDIEIDGETVATAHSLTAVDRMEIEKHSTSKTITAEGMKLDISSQGLQLYTVAMALDSWILDEPLTVANLAKHPMLPRLFDAVQAHESLVAETIAGNEKN